RLVAVKSLGSVARAVWVAIAPRAQATNAPATIRFNVFWLIVLPPAGVCAARKPAVVGGAVIDEGAAVCGRPTLGRHPSLLRSDEDSGTAVPSPTPPAPRRRLAARLSGQRPGVDLLFREAVCARMTRAPSARRPGAGAV